MARRSLIKASLLTKKTDERRHMQSATSRSFLHRHLKIEVNIYQFFSSFCTSFACQRNLHDSFSKPTMYMIRFPNKQNNKQCNHNSKAVFPLHCNSYLGSGTVKNSFWRKMRAGSKRTLSQTSSGRSGRISQFLARTV